MNICLVAQDFPPETAQGGIGTQTFNKARALTTLGHVVHVLSSGSSQNGDVRTEVLDGMTIHRMTPPGEEPGNEFAVYNTATYWLAYSWSVLRQLHRLMQSTAFDVIDFAEYGAEGFAYQLDRTPWNWVPVVVQLHAPLAMLAEHIGWPEKDSDLYRYGTLMEGTSIKRADGLMACSANIARFTAGFYDVPIESIDVVHCGVESDAFLPTDERTNRDSRPTVLFVGNIAANKGLPTIFNAVLALRAKYPNIRLQVLGNSDDDLEQEFKSRARAQGAEGNIEFCGFVGRAVLPDFYRRADVFASPAQYEGGVANVYLEAMSSGCPVIASTAGGGPEAVIDGLTGLLVPPNDLEATTAAIDRILSDPALRDRMGHEGRRRVEEHFAMDKYILRVLDTYEKAIARSKEKLDRMKSEVGETQAHGATA
jgi:glycosyltransferase involved in cell wall biosynthesis